MSRSGVSATMTVLAVGWGVAAASATVALVAAAPPLAAQAPTLALPPRAADAPGGSDLARDLAALSRQAREERAFAELAAGNVPAWLRRLRPVRLAAEIDGREREATVWVTPDYLAVGSDDDYFLLPLTPRTAQRLADRAGALLPTPRIVDAIWAAAELRLAPSPIPPSPAMTTVPVFRAHDRAVAGQRGRAGGLAGRLVAGHKKDVVLTSRLAEAAGRVAIYGWHGLDGRPIQPLYVGHTDGWVDYSHGLRLVSRRVRVEGEEHDLAAALADPALAPLFSDEGVIALPRYSVQAGSPGMAGRTGREGGSADPPKTAHPRSGSRPSCDAVAAHPSASATSLTDTPSGTSRRSAAGSLE